MRRIIVVCPGRGSYARESLGTLPQTPSVAAADAFRAALGRPTPTDMDGAAAYTSRLHVAGENASILTMTASLADRDLLRDVEIVAVVGNSMGWYTALSVAGALPDQDALRLVETFGNYQAGNVIGGQLVYPLVDGEWRIDDESVAAVERALAEVPDLYWSIRLGGQAVLGGSEVAIAQALASLPKRLAGGREAPFQLPLHSAFHTPLMGETARRASSDLAGLGWRAPDIPLVDGTGKLWLPGTADPIAMGQYTLGSQVTAPYDFTTSVRVALSEYAPDAVVLLGPGGNLGGAVAQAMVRGGWRGVRSRGDFVDLQTRDPFVLAMSRPDQRALVT